jgi:hypothetical protein
MGLGFDSISKTKFGFKIKLITNTFNWSSWVITQHQSKQANMSQTHHFE